MPTSERNRIRDRYGIRSTVTSEIGFRFASTSLLSGWSFCASWHLHCDSSHGQPFFTVRVLHCLPLDLQIKSRKRCCGRRC